MSELPRPVVDALLEQAPWLGRLARALVGPDGADDLTQDVWVAALRRPPVARGSVRSWLRQVTLNRVRETRRSEARRLAREGLVAVPDEVEGPLRRFDLHRELVRHIGELEDPWRRTLLLRYFDEQPLKTIASREGVPISTVSTRLRKAEALLRSKLDDAHDGDRSHWTALLVPLVRTSRPPASFAAPTLTGFGVPLLAMKLPYLLAVLVVTVVAAYLVLPDRQAEPVVASKPSASKALAAAPLGPTLREAEAARSPDERRALDVSPPPEPQAQGNAPDPGSLPLVGTVVDVQGKAMPELEVWLTSAGTERLLGTSDTGGRFHLDGQRDLGRIEVRDENWGTALGCDLPLGARQGPTLIVAPWIEVGGVVRGEEGDLIPRAQMTLAQPSSLRASVADLHGRSISHEPVTHSDELGAFLFERALAVEGTTIYVEAQGFSAAEVPLPMASTRSFEIVLQRPRPTAGHVRGRVVDAGGGSVQDAWVSLGFHSTRSDPDGLFEIETGREGRFDRLVAIKDGHQPAILDRPRAEANGQAEAWPDFVQLRLGNEPLSLGGRVTDAQGRPLVGWRVWLADPTFFSRVDQRGVMVEGIAQGLLGASDEDQNPTAAWPWTSTDAEGRFTLEGLLDRDYALRIHHPESLLLVEAGPFRAGRRDADVALELEELYGPIEGRVVDPEGNPMADVTIESWVVTYQTPHDEMGHLGWSEQGSSVTTDENGHYRIPRLPRDGVSLRPRHPDILPQILNLEREADGKPRDRESWDRIDFVCDLRYHLQVEIDPAWSERGQLSLLDSEGQETLIQVFSAGGQMSTHRYRFEEGKTEVLSVNGKARELVFYDSQGTELERRKIRLIFGELNRLRL